MTRTPKPKPVEAWASVTLDGKYFVQTQDPDDPDTWIYLITHLEAEAYGPQIRVRIVPVPEKSKKRKPKTRTKRKTRRKS